MADEFAPEQKKAAPRPVRRRGAPRPGAKPDAPAKKRKKPNFNKAFVVSGIFIGIMSGLPFLNYLNMIIFLWAWIGGIAAAKIFSRIYPRIELMHGAICGAIAGMLGALIAVPLSAGNSYILTKYVFKANAHEILRHVQMPWDSAPERANLLNDVLLKWFPRPHHPFAHMSWYETDNFGRYMAPGGLRCVDYDPPVQIPKWISMGTAAKRIVLHFFFLEVGFFICGTLGGIIGASLFAYKPPRAEKPPEGQDMAYGLDAHAEKASEDEYAEDDDDFT
ncbi:MAG: hypothetical protein ACYS8W_08835 [Planctomycetota bacterium]|jgi:hypothetical protein